jgi:TRAP-type transport system periplasmic protein
VVIQSIDLIPSLQSGLVDGFPNAPLYALSTQSFALAPNMLDLPWSPLMGATVIGKDKWDEIPAEYQQPLLEAAQEITAAHRDEIRRQHVKSIEVMVKYGLNVVEIDDATRQLWHDRARASYPYLREEVLPAELFDRTLELVEEYRALQP